MSAADYDVVVVGAGMFGSSAAKHLRRLQPSLRVAVVGPDNNCGPLARGQHFDEARICRRVETLVPWAHLNDLGALSYRETEATSGIGFYTPCGCVWVGTAADRDATMACMAAVQRASGGADAVSYAVVREDVAGGGAGDEAAAVAGKTSVLRVTASSAVAEGVFGGGIRVGQLAPAGAATYYVVESGPAGGGTVHPTRYVEAQLACAAAVSPASHFTWVREVVVQIECGDDGVYAVKTDAEHTYRAGRVLVATASFARYHKLLPSAITALIHPHPAYVVLVRVDPPHGDDHDANVKASESFPSVICTTGSGASNFYALPPRYYADRSGWFIKMGRGGDWHSPVKDADVQDLAGAMEWYDVGSTVPVANAVVQQVASCVRGLYPAWPLADEVEGRENTYVVRCIFDETDDEVPVIGAADGMGLFCAMGGCGRGAKACDPIGCIAAHRLLGKELPPAYKFAESLFHPKSATA